MKVLKSSWHYRWWKFSHLWNRLPQNPDAVSYWLRVVFLAPFLGIVLGGIGVLIFLILLVLFFLYFPLVSGWYLFTGSGYPDCFYPLDFKRWPAELSEIFGPDNFITRCDGFWIGRFKFYPYRVAILGAAVGLWWIVLSSYPSDLLAFVGVGLAILVTAIRLLILAALGGVRIIGKAAQRLPRIEFVELREFGDD